MGLDIGRDSIKMLQVEVLSPLKLAVRAADQETFPEEARAQPALRLGMAGEMVRRMLRRGGFAGRRVVAALPREIVHIKSFRLPQMPPHELEPAVRFETRQLFGFEPEQAQVRCLPAGEVRQGNDTLQEVIVLAARNDEVSRFLEQLHRCGMVVDSLDVQPCALYRTVERFIRRRDDEQLVNVLVDVGLGASQVVIGRGRQITFTKTAEIGGAHFDEAVSRRLQVPPGEAQALRRRMMDAPADGEAGASVPEAVRRAMVDAMRGVMEQLAQEVLLCLRYQSVTFRGQRAARVRLTGGEGRDPQLQATLQTVLGIPVEAVNPLLNLDISRMPPHLRCEPMTEWAVALGLSLKRTVGRFGGRDGPSRAVTARILESAAPETAAAEREMSHA